MRLVVLHPEIPDCETCQKYHFNEQWERTKFRGEWLERRPDQPPRCRTDKGCARGTPERPNTLSAKNAAAYEHYLESRATGQFPDDPIVRRNARLIRMIEDLAEQRRMADMLGLARLDGMTKGLG